MTKNAKKFAADVVKLMTASVAVLVAGASVSATVQAQNGGASACRAVVGGSYSFASLGNGNAGALLNPPTTTPTTPTMPTNQNYSNSEVGKLLSGLAGNKPFATSGTLRLNPDESGGGGIITASAPALNLIDVQVGTYTLNDDCTITVTLWDTFNFPGGVVPMPPVRNSTTLQGIVLRNGGEIALGTFRNAPTGDDDTTTPPPPPPATTTPPGMSTAGQWIQSNTMITLSRTHSSTCSPASLTGTYGLVITGTGASNVNTTDTDPTNDIKQVMPFFIIATVQFDGAGRVSSDNLPQSPLSYLRYSGAYQINASCTGTMMLTGVASADAAGTPTNPPATPGTSATQTATTLRFDFVLTKPLVEVNAAGQAPSAGQSKAGIQIISSATSQTFRGEGFAVDQ